MNISESECEKKVPRTLFSAKWLSSYFWTDFAELPVGLISFTLLLMMVFEQDFADAVFTIPQKEPYKHVLTLIMMFSGIGLSLFHVFSTRRKTNLEKRLMISLAVICCCISAMYCGYRLISESASLLTMLFGLINILEAMIYSMLLRTNVINEKNFSDCNTPWEGAFANFLIILVMYLLMKFVLDIHWGDAFSICLAYAMTFSVRLSNWINPHTPASSKA